MTVRELIKELHKLDPRLDVYVELERAFDSITEVRVKKWEDQKIVVLS